MRRNLTLVTDGSPAAAALAAWLANEVPGVLIATGSSPRDVGRLVERRRSTGRSERIATLAPVDVPDADISGVEALAAARRWLDDLGPFEQRVHGPKRIAAAIADGAPGSGAVLGLLRALARGRPPPAPPPRRRGRPRGDDPFRGAGFDVCVALLLAPDEAWSERALAAAADRSPYAVHRALVALDERGYLERQRGATRVRDPRVLRDDLAMAWSRRAPEERAAIRFLAPRPAHVAEDLFEAAGAIGARALLAGASATTGPAGLSGGLLTVYGDADLPSLLEAAGFERVERVVGDVTVWTAPEEGVFASPRRIRGLPATNRVVTFLDLSAAGGDRYLAAAAAVWSEAA